MNLRDELPVDHRLTLVYRIGAAGCGVLLLAFGCLGFTNELGFFSTEGARVAGLSTNGLLSLVSLVVGAVLVVAACVGGNVASTVNMVVGGLFVLSGFVNLFLIGKSANLLDFSMSNVIFSFVMGLLILTFGMYGRVTGGLPHDNPYWRRRHPEQAAREDARAGAVHRSPATALTRR
ncbi:DUF4383 domain-containing protein [Streptomyces subrutilus]|uniref:DUF4383 domain-containing protein n=1 Tax=Streptomyces subrutilus TaxID=36818 RepID=A0A5P2UTS6_9ACTN|nr:DUF4383 domain-containing protein [Streptomyces subrutilus]QEU82523.1 DUF4383 domain-containing protein [Streptomyces subrutilus]WSJ28002.1 DUF4383 domain-containing protein [Streptomyces subrutilus]GGZ81809.1 hypothetical protein GCM10010371_46780 [Streptomyces subrutilus]